MSPPATTRSITRTCTRTDKTALTLYHINLSERTLHFKQPAGTSRGVYTTRHSYYLTLTSDEHPGIEGIGECATLPDLSCDAKPEYEPALRQICQMVEQMGRIPYDMIRAYPSITFGLETAFADFFRQTPGDIPAWAGILGRLFDTPFARGDEGIPINGLVWMGSYEEMYARLEEKLQRGFHCVKLKIGAIDFMKELNLIRHIRQHFDRTQIELRVDANGGFTPDDAMSRLEALAQYDIHSIEQPIKQHQWPQMARLSQDSPLPIALDEELIGVNVRSMKAALLDTIHPAYIVLKPSLHGGIYGCEEWISLAWERGIGSWITSALESNVGLNAIAHYCAQVYGPGITFPQGLGTGQLFTDNIPMPLEIRGDKLWTIHQ
jgi:o-succinylbenzoate synthase